MHTITPADTYNPPQRSALAYRIGTHGSFRETMQARLSAYKPLRRLLTEDSDDPSIALLDCFALIGDILTFYQERIANEGYLRTAIEPQSLDYLGKLVGYRARPALGADTYLAYTLDPGAKTVIPLGSGAKSVPRQNELPQTFETSEDLKAREEWNNLAPAMTRPPMISYYGPKETTELDDVNEIAGLNIAGTTANLKAGDRLLFLFDPAPPPENPAADPPDGYDPRMGTAVRVVVASTPDFQAATTAVALLSKRTQFSTALAELENAVNNALNNSTGASVEQLKTDYLDKLTKRLFDKTITTHEIFNNVLDEFSSVSLPEVLDHLTELAALASVHESRLTVAWYTTYVSAILDAGRKVIRLAETALRRKPDEIEALQWRAHEILCPSSGKGFAPILNGVDCDAGAALVALTPMLPWLRRAPSQPPRKARDIDPGALEWLRPDSDVHAKLLAAADPRVAPNLHQAWKYEQVSAPLVLTNLQVLRLKATIADISDGAVIYLDTVYDGIQEGSWVVAVGVTNQVRRVQKVEQSTREVSLPAPAPAGAQSLTVPSTHLTLDARLDTQGAGAVQAGAALYAQGETLTPVGDPITDDIEGDSVELGHVYDELQPGRWLVVSGERTDVPYTSGIRAAELTMVAGVRQFVDPDKPATSVRTVLKLTSDLSYRYRRDSVTVYGNVVAATQGETRHEILGSGDAGQPNQSFRIRQVNEDNPLTALPSSNPAGFDDQLWVTVGGVRWRPTEILATAAATDHAYRPVVGADKFVDIQFGDGVHGARTPTGIQNVAAKLRVGAGRGGNAIAGQISQLASQPLGVSAVTNPIAANGGTDGDTSDDARTVTPLRMLALDRLLSVRDYEDYTRARAGIGKASARKLFDGERQVVHLTVASIGDASINTQSGLMTALRDSLAEFGDPGVTIRVDVRDMVLLLLRAGIKVDADHTWDLVEPAVRAALLDTFSFARHELAQDAYLSEAFAAAQAVPGVDYVDIDIFHGLPSSVTPIELLSLADHLGGPDWVVRAEAAKFEPGQFFRSDEDLTLTQAALRTGMTAVELCKLNPTLTNATIPAFTPLTIFRGIRPAQIVVLPPDVPEALMLRRIP